MGVGVALGRGRSQPAHHMRMQLAFDEGEELQGGGLEVADLQFATLGAGPQELGQGIAGALRAGHPEHLADAVVGIGAIITRCTATAAGEVIMVKNARPMPSSCSRRAPSASVTNSASGSISMQVDFTASVKRVSLSPKWL